MDYCILVELSRKQIAFSYYTGDIDRFEPYGDELVKPLAVWFSGNSVVVGVEAKREAQKGTPNAFYDLFELMKQQSHFDYANEKHDYNKLILYTIKAGLKEFFQNVMLNSQGTLDENIAKLPLALVIGTDVELNERHVLLNQLRDNGFGNVTEVEEEVYIIKSFSKSTDSAEQISLILSCNDDNLYGDVYRGNKLIESFTFKNAGKDPRVDKLANLIWERTQAEYAWLDKEQEFTELRNAAIRFIQSGDIQRDDSVTLSNGEEYTYYLTREDLNLYNQGDGGHIAKEIISKVLAYCNKQDCLVVLNNEAATNRYLHDLLSPEFPRLKEMNKENKEVIYSMIVNSFKESSFIFPQPNGVKKSPNLVVPQKAESGTATKRDEQNFKKMVMSVETYLCNNDKNSAMREVQTFLDDMHSKGINQFDAKAEELLSGFVISQTPIQSNKPTPLNKREFKILQKTLETALSNGATEKVLQDIKNFEKDMHSKSIIAFDDELNVMKQKLKSASMKVQKPAVKPSMREQSTISSVRHATVKDVLEKPTIQQETDANIDKAGKLMREAKFKEARELYRKNNCETQANDCTTLIKWGRLLTQYKSETTATANTHNVEKAKARVQEIKEYISLYRKYGIDTKALEALQNDYKRIK